jgi:hypothetical protein
MVQDKQNSMHKTIILNKRTDDVEKVLHRQSL